MCLVGIGIRCPRPRCIFLGAPHVAIDVGALRGCYAKCKSHGEYAERTKVASIGLERLLTQSICALRFGTVCAVAQENRFGAEGQVSRIGGDRSRLRNARGLHLGQLNVEGARQPRYDCILHLKQVARVNIELVGPDMSTTGGIDKQGSESWLKV